MTITDPKEITNYMFESGQDTIKESFKIIFDAYVEGKSESFIQDTKDLMKAYFSDRSRLLTKEGYEEYISFFRPKLITHDPMTGREGDVYFTYL